MKIKHVINHHISNKNIPIKHVPRLDLKLGVKLAGGNKKLANIILKSMINNLIQAKTLINNAIKKNNYTKIKEYVHMLYGGCCYTGLLKLKKILKYILTKLEDDDIIKNYYINNNKIKSQLYKYIELLNKEIDFLNLMFND